MHYLIIIRSVLVTLYTIYHCEEALLVWRHCLAWGESDLRGCCSERNFYVKRPKPDLYSNMGPLAYGISTLLSLES